MNFNFELILFYAMLTTGAIFLLDVIFFAKRRKKKYQSYIKNISSSLTAPKLPILIDYSRAFFPVLLIVFLLRAFLYEPFRIPSGSLEPTLSIGDFILVNKFHYGIRLPILHIKIYSINQPKRGDIIVFRWPPDPSIDFIKRVIGVPGDRIDYIDKILYINGKKISQVFNKKALAYSEDGSVVEVIEKKEALFDVKHSIFQDTDKPRDDIRDIIVPPGMYFVMGDNRDMSADSRYWGFVPDENIVGKAHFVWMSWNSINHTIRWERIGKNIN